MQENNLVAGGLNFPEEIETAGENYTLIEVSSKKYAIKTQNILEIIKVIEMDCSHQMPSYILGIIDFERAPIGVIDLREILGNDRVVYDLNAKIVVIKVNEVVISIICDSVYDIKKLPKNKIQKIPYQQEAEFFDGMYADENENVYILNIENILTYTRENSKKFITEQDSRKYLVNDETSKEILKSRRDFLTKIVSEIQNTKALYDKGVTFSVNDTKYYINMASVREFYKVNKSKFIKIPNTKDYIYGLTNIKGEYITVLDLRRFFNYPKTQIKEKSTIIIINSDEFKLGILADEIGESMDVDFDEIIQNRLSHQDETKMMEFVKDNEIYQVLDIEKLLQDERLTIA
ncbi:chemotaxis protein CheW [bacterium]|nr:chemotaxis protein CheW [bacterium]